MDCRAVRIGLARRPTCLHSVGESLACRKNEHFLLPTLDQKGILELQSFPAVGCTRVMHSDRPAFSIIAAASRRS
jgi:hypothetical protein